MTKTGSNDAECVISALSEFFLLFISFFLDTNMCLLVIQVVNYKLHDDGRLLGQNGLKVYPRGYGDPIYNTMRTL